MPLKLNIGLSRKVGEANYGSRGASIHLEVEVDSSVASDPTRLQGHIREVFDLVRTSLDEELRGQVVASAPATMLPAHGSECAVPHHSNGRAQRPATRAQFAALRRLAERLQIDLDAFFHERFGVNGCDELTVAQASQSIRALQDLTAAAGRCP